MKFRRGIPGHVLAALAVWLAGAGVAAAESTPEARREEWRQLSPEQREQRRAELRDRWERMSPEQREQMKRQIREHRRDMAPEAREAPEGHDANDAHGQMHRQRRERWESMTPEERRNLRETMREHRQQR